MLDFIKKQWIGFYAAIVAAVFIIVSFALVIANGNTEYYGDAGSLGGIIAMLIVSLVLVIAANIVAQFSFADNKFVSIGVAVVRAVAAMLVIIAGIAFIGERIESFGYIYGSNLELGNDAAFAAGGQAITTIIICVIAWVLALIAACFSVKRKTVTA